MKWVVRVDVPVEASSEDAAATEVIQRLESIYGEHGDVLEVETYLMAGQDEPATDEPCPNCSVCSVCGGIELPEGDSINCPNHDAEECPAHDDHNEHDAQADNGRSIK